MKLILAVSFFCFTNYLQAQIHFRNPSFETIDTFRASVPPTEWITCRNNPDVVPNADYTRLGVFFPTPSDGDCALGMLSCNNSFLPNCFEAAGQEINTTLSANQDYYFFIDNIQRYGSDILGQGKFRIYLGNSFCDTSQIIYTSSIVDTTWRRVLIQFSPNGNKNYVTFSSTLFPVFSNLLSDYVMLDNLSPIYQGIYTGTEPAALQGSAAVRVFPNPSTGLFYFERGTEAHISGLRVYDVLGRPVQAPASVSEGWVDLTGLPGGVYFLELRSEGSEVVKRVKVLKN